MDNQSQWGLGKGNDENLREYRIRNERKRLVRKLFVPLSVVFVVLLAALMVLLFGFRVRTITVEGDTGYSSEELIAASGINLKDNLLFLGDREVEASLKDSFPYIKEVELEKDYPSGLIIHVVEEKTTFYYEAEGEYFLFDYNLRVMDKFDSLEALQEVRTAILVDMPLPKSCVVRQGISFDPQYSYVESIIHQLSESQLVQETTYLDLRDKFVLRMECGKGVAVELGDYHDLQDKFSSLLSLLGEKGKKMTGSVDFSCYPRCFYDLREDYDS